MGKLSDSRVTAVYAEIECTKYRVALVKQSGADLYVYTLYDEQGTLISIDLCDQTTRIFRDVVGGHRTLHASGDAHTRIEMKIGSKHQSETLKEMDGWRDFEITIPLDSVPSEAPAHAPWNEVTREIVLRSVDFENAAGMNLIFCLALPETMATRERWDRRWVLEGERTIVVGAKRIAYPGERVLDREDDTGSITSSGSN